MVTCGSSAFDFTLNCPCSAPTRPTCQMPFFVATVDKRRLKGPSSEALQHSTFGVLTRLKCLTTHHFQALETESKLFRVEVVRSARPTKPFRWCSGLKTLTLTRICSWNAQFQDCRLAYMTLCAFAPTPLVCAENLVKV